MRHRILLVVLVAAFVGGRKAAAWVAPAIGLRTSWVAPAIGLRTSQKALIAPSSFAPSREYCKPRQEICMEASAGEWEKIGGGKAGDAVCKKILEQGSGKLAEAGAEIEVEYVGTLGDIDWTVDDVLECWLEAQQGMSMYKEAFLKHQVDGGKLLSADTLTEAFVTETLGVANKLHAKKLVSAAKKLREYAAEYASGSVFDSSAANKPFKFVLGKGKVIKGWEMSVATMRLGEHAEVKLRADYAYGKDGFRLSSGKVLVPPFATLKFKLKLLSAYKIG